MIRSLSRALILAAAGALAGGISTACWYARAPGWRLDFERDLPAVVRGLYPLERAAGVPFAWTSPGVVLSLPGADRRVAWRCTLRARGARPAQVAPAELMAGADGVTLLRRRLANDVPEELSVTVPPRADANGLVLTLAVTPPFQPGPGDRRQLGAEVTAFACAPDSGAARAPSRAWLAGGAVTAFAGAALGLAGLPLVGAMAGIVAIALASGVTLAWGSGPYGAFPHMAVGLGAWTAIVAVLLVAVAGRVRHRPLGPGARAAIMLSALLFIVEALALLHPAKTLVDAVFHAHRLEWVLEGRLLFTQPMPSGVRFPYAIALYIAAAPWTLLTLDHVALLKIVVLASRAIAGLLLYPVVLRGWRDPGAGIAAIVLFHTVPLPFVVIGNANLTYAFGASMAVIAIAAAVAVGLGAWHPRGAIGLTAAAALAFLSHVGVFPLVAAVLIVTAAGYATAGGRPLRRAAVVVAGATVLAALFSVVVYYGHFGEAYRTLARVRAQPASAARPADAPGAGGMAAPGFAERCLSAAQLARRAFGWPVLLLAATGLVLWLRRGWRDPLGIVLAAILLSALAFEAASAAAPVAPGFWRYTAEFISRVNYVALAAVVILAGRAVSAGWKAGGARRITAAAALALAAGEGTSVWLSWVR